MTRVLLLAVLATACGNDTVPAVPDAPAGSIDAAVSADAPDTITDITGNVTADTTWSGLVKIHSDITIASGVTLTVQPKTRIQIAPGVTVTVAGTMTVAGVKGGIVTIEELVAGEYWNMFYVGTGALNLDYVRMTGGGFGITGSGHLTVRDSQMSTVTHDLLVVSGGVVDVQYSWIGLDHGLADTTHCDMHFEGGSPTITVSHTNLSTSAYGLMFYGGANVDLRYDNWWGNGANLDESVTPVTGDISYGWFEGTVPPYTNLTKTGMASSQVADAGPR